MTILRPTKKTTPDDWARDNRVYGASTGFPGPRRPELTPYVIAFERAIASGQYKRVVFSTGAQSGKTDSFLDIVGARLDQRPEPIIYVGPSRDFLTDQFEPRLMTLLDEAATLRKKVVRGRRMKKTLKKVAGVSVRLAHAGSSSALKSDPAALAIIDEYDEMSRNVRGQGDVLGLTEARGFTYANFCAAVASTPSRGIIDTEMDPNSGLEFWKVADAQDLESKIWKLFQEGTRYHWSWPCPHCGEYFIPRFKCLRWPEGATPAQAMEEAFLECPRCGGVIEDHHRKEMNARGVYVAPGQRVTTDGEVIGDPPHSTTCSFWTSGLASPFVTIGERVEAYLKAVASGDDDKMQTAVNAGFGECYASGVSGDALDWQAVAERRRPYSFGEVPVDVLRITAGVDVQKRSLYYTIRGWGAMARSWQIDCGELFGPTDENDVWQELLKVLTRDYDGLVVEKAMVDSGFRPNKPTAGDEHKVYEFCRKHSWLCLPTKGKATQTMPIRQSQVEVNVKGKKQPRSMTLYHLDSDFFKSLVHSRLGAEDHEAGAFHISADTPEDYCRQIVSEWRTIAPDTGKPHWIVRNRRNHYLDCEALAAAAAYMLRVQTIPDGTKREKLATKPARGADTQAPQSSTRERFAGLSAKLNR